MGDVGTLAYGDAGKRVSPGDVEPFVTASDIGATSVYWTQPYPNPNPAGTDDAYLWLGSTDHASGPGTMYRGVSPAPGVAPESWDLFLPAGVGPQRETPFFVHSPGDARPFRLYWHAGYSASGGNQASRLTSHTDPAWEAGTDEGEVLPATAGVTKPLLPHTGYMIVERRSGAEWHAWSMTEGGTEPTHGYWTSSDGVVWTCVDDTLDTSTMCEPGDILMPSNGLIRFSRNGVTYALTRVQRKNEIRPFPNTSGGRVAVCEMPDERTFGPPTVVWDPKALGYADRLRGGPHGLVDPGNPDVIHLYLHIATTSVFHVRFSTVEMSVL